jgi:predicted Zn-dependent peptidase
MIKKDLSGLGYPFFEQKLENGVSLIFVPRKSQLKSALVYVNYGGYYKSEEVMGIKEPFGSAYYLEHMLMSDEFRKSLAQKGILGSSHTDFSYSYYELDTLGDIYDGLRTLMDRISFGKFTEKDVEEFKKSELLSCAKLDRDPRNMVQKKALDNLYYESPIKMGVIPTKEESITIHASGLKKFLEAYYVPSRICIMVSMDDTPAHFMEEVNKLHLPLPLAIYEKPHVFTEIYDKVNREYNQFKYEAHASYLSYAVKMPPRKDLYENYGQMLFSIYEVLEKALFTMNPKFQNGLNQVHAELLDTRLEQGFEDAYLAINLKTEAPNEALNFVTAFLANAAKEVDRSLLKKVQDQYFASSLASLSVPSQALHGFALAYANNMPYTGLIGQTMKMSYSYFKNYLADFQTFRRAASYLRRA